MNTTNTFKHLIYRLFTPVLLTISLVACTAENLDSTGTATIPDNTSNDGADQLLTELGHLIWTAPSQREDSTPLNNSEIDTYKVYYGTTSGFYQNQIDISNIVSDSANLDSFESGTYYFAVTTIDTDGRESKFSQEISVTF